MADGSQQGNQTEFDKKLADWQESAQLFQTQLSTTQAQLDSYSKQYQQLAQAKIPLWQRIPQYLAALPTGGISLTIPPPSMFQLNLLKQQISDSASAIESNDFYARLYGQLPFAISAGKVNSPQEALTLLKPPANLTADETASINNIISDMIATITQPVVPQQGAGVAAGTLEYPELVAPSPVIETPVGLHQLSTQEIIKALTIIPAPTSAMTTEQWNAFLQSKGYTAADIDQQQQIQAEQLITEWADRNTQVDEFRAGVAEMPDWTLVDILKEMAVQPGLALLELSNVYRQHVSLPLAGLIYSKLIPDLELEYQRYRAANPDASASDAYAAAYQYFNVVGPMYQKYLNSLTPAGKKCALTEDEFAAQITAGKVGAAEFFIKYLLMEGAVDPLSYVGWGIATKVVRGLGGLGKFGATIIAVDQGTTAALNLPFDVLKWAMGKIPKTTAQVAAMNSHASEQYVQRYMEEATKKPIYDIGMEEFNNLSAKAVDYALAHPQSETTIALAGQEMLRHAPVTGDLVKDWSSRLGTTLVSEDVTRATVGNVDNLFEDYFSKGIITSQEAAGQLLKILNDAGAQIADDASGAAMKTAQRILEDRAASIKQAALAFAAAEHPLLAMANLAAKTYRVSLAAADSAAAMARKEASAISILLHNVKLPIQNVWRNAIQKYGLYQPAQAYLAMGLYGPQNVLEDVMVSLLDGVIPGRMGAKAFMRSAMGLVYDAELTRDAISEMIGYIERRGAGRNNWILSFFGLARGLGEKTYGALVENPGRIGIALRRNFVYRRYAQILADKGGAAYKGLLECGPKEVPPEISQKWLRRELQRAIKELKATGNPELANAFKEDFSRENIVANEVLDIFKEHPDIPMPVRNYVMQQFENGILMRSPKDIERVIGVEARNLVLEDFLRSPEVAAQQYKQLTNHLIALDVRNPQEMATAIQAIYKMSEIYGALPEQVMALATIRSRGLPLAGRRLAFDMASDRIYNFLDSAGADIDKVITKLRLTTQGADLVNNVDWSKVVFSNIPDIATRTSIRTTIDKLPFSMKMYTKEIRISKIECIAVEENLGGAGEVLAFYDPLTNDIVIRDVETALDSHVLVHELGHSWMHNKIRSEGDSILGDFAESAGYTSAAHSIRLRYCDNPAISYHDFTNVHESFAEAFSHYVNNPNALVGGETKFFENILPKIQTALPFGMDYTQAAQSLLDIMITKRTYATEFRVQNAALRHEIFAGVSRDDMTPEFWGSFYSQMTNDYRIFNVKMAELDGRIASAMERLNSATGAKAFARPPVVVTNRPLAPQDVANLLGVRGDDISRALLDVLTVQNNKDFFVNYVLAMVRPSDVGFTREAVGAVYDQIAYSLRVSPESMSWITGKNLELDAVRQELHNLYNSKLLPPEEVAAIGKYFDDTAAAMKNTLFEPGKGKQPFKPQYANYHDLRQAAMDEAHKWYYKTYTDYTNANVFDAIMKNIYPYWTYESQRWLRLPRIFLTKPGFFMSFERFQDNTDQGYVHIPGTSIDINPFRGTLFGTITTRLTRRDYPEYYDSLGAAGGLVQFNDFLSRYGFYPGFIYNVPVSMMGGLEQQMGETLPAVWKTPLDALIAAFPEDENVKWLSDHVFSDRFRDYMIILDVNKRGYDGTLIWTKISEGKTLTPEEQAAWDAGRRTAGLYGMLFEQTGLFRFRPEEMTRAREASAAVIERMTGYTPEQQKWLTAHGYRIWDLVGGLSPTDQAILQQMDTYKWIGATMPLLPSRQQDVQRQLELDWNDVMTYVENTKAQKLQLQSDFLSGKLGPREYNDRLQALYADQRAYIDQKMIEDPVMTLEGRAEYYEKYGVVVPVQHPFRELLNLYFSIELKDKYDEETGELVTDWETFFAQRQAIEDAIPPELKAEWDAYLSRNTTRIEQIRQDVYDAYFRKYYDIWQASLELYPEDEQRLINEYLYLQRTGQQLERQAEIKAMVSAKTGNSLISSFQSDVSNNRAALRYANPYLDAWLFYWGRVSAFKTPQALAAYQQICADTGRVV